LIGLCLASLLSACEARWRPLGGPFYIGYTEDPRDTAIFRCPDGPDGGCAIDGLPGPRVVAAGADDRYVVAMQHPGWGDQADLSRTQYFYFARSPQEGPGYGSGVDPSPANPSGIPEHIVGPMTREAFEADKTRLRLPEFTWRRTD
jgi:hypothetical protein